MPLIAEVFTCAKAHLLEVGSVGPLSITHLTIHIGAPVGLKRPSYLTHAIEFNP